MHINTGMLRVRFFPLFEVIQLKNFYALGQ